MHLDGAFEPHCLRVIAMGSQVEFAEPLDSPTEMPLRLPVLPVYEPGFVAERATEQSRLRSVLDLEHCLLVDSGSSAIGLALDLIGVATGDDVLVPAYNCPTMVTPILERGARAVFYAIQEDTTVDPDVISAAIGSRCKAVLVAHFFAIFQDLTRIRDICDQAGIALIEDCAHRFFGGQGGPAPGSIGDYAIASATKFFGISDGGCLGSNRLQPDSAKVGPLGWLEEVKRRMDIYERSAEYGKLGVWTGAMRGLVAAKQAVRRPGRPEDATGGAAAVTEQETLTRTPIRAMSNASRKIMRSTDADAAARIRRRNFSMMNERLSSTPGFTTLPLSHFDVDVPYMYPLIVDDPSLYSALRDKDWPVWRWDDSDRSCDVSRHYAEHLLQLPCHQSLTEADIETLAAAVVAARD